MSSAGADQQGAAPVFLCETAGRRQRSHVVESHHAFHVSRRSLLKLTHHGLKTGHSSWKHKQTSVREGGASGRATAAAKLNGSTRIYRIFSCQMWTQTSGPQGPVQMVQTDAEPGPDVWLGSAVTVSPMWCRTRGSIILAICWFSFAI